MPEQVTDEIARGLESAQRYHRMLGIEVSRYQLSRRGKDMACLGDDALWQDAERQLAAALDRLGLAYDDAAGEAAFYGPKIDVQVTDPAGREETLSTVQLDFIQPERLDLGYTGSDGRRHRPVVIHRGVLSSMDRMVAYLIERHEGAPALAHSAPGTRAAGQRPAGRAGQVADRADPRGRAAGRVRSSRRQPGGTDPAGPRAPHSYVTVIGDREASSGLLAVRLRDGRQLRDISVANLIAEITRQVTGRSAGLGFGTGCEPDSVP